MLPTSLRKGNYIRIFKFRNLKLIKFIRSCLGMRLPHYNAFLACIPLFYKQVFKVVMIDCNFFTLGLFKHNISLEVFSVFLY